MKEKLEQELLNDHLKLVHSARSIKDDGKIKNKDMKESAYFSSTRDSYKDIDKDDDPFNLFGNGTNVLKAFMGDLTWMLFLVTLASLPILAIYRS